MSQVTPSAVTLRRWTGLLAVRSWRLWEIPRLARLVIVGVESATVLAFLGALSTAQFRQGEVVRWLLLAGLSVLYAEVAARIERMRRFLNSATHISMTSVWAFAAVLSLPAAYAGALVAFLFGYSSWQRRDQRSLVPHRVCYTAATAILAALAASAVASALIDHLPELSSRAAHAIATLIALAVYFGVNASLVLTTIYLAVGQVPLRQLLPDREEVGLEFATLVLGILTAQTLILQPWLTPLVLVLMVLLQRSSLVGQLEVAAATDAKTGLLNASAWQELAQRELVRSQHAGLPCAVLLLDLDHFKQVNDSLGHLAGDSALRAIGDALKRELRGYDAVARFGGEEFVVFLNDLNIDAALVVAERTLSRIRGLVFATLETNGHRLTLTASIGLATYPAHGQDLTDLLEAADVALYAAKHAGRDQVGLPPEPYPEPVIIAEPA